MSTAAGQAGPRAPRAVAFGREGDLFAGRFSAMASPCEVLLDIDDASAAREVADQVAAEAWRIERKFSRYRDDGVLHAIHAAQGRPIELDEESASLLDYAQTCWEASGGLFDITSGVLRRVWTFDGSDRVPAAEDVRRVLEQVGWGKVEWRPPVLALPAGMELDLGGVGKEYAVDRAAALVASRTSSAFVVNFGGDLYARGPRRGARPWGVGVDDPARTGEAAVFRIELVTGGLATSGDARRFVLWNGRRLGHILDPRTGWPVEGAPRSVTVLSDHCLEAGTLSTLAALQGPRAAEFLREQGVRHWLL